MAEPSCTYITTEVHGTGLLDPASPTGAVHVLEGVRYRGKWLFQGYKTFQDYKDRDAFVLGLVERERGRVDE